jgi:hypothetical protein
MTTQTSSGDNGPKKNFWDTAEKISKTVSIAAIPIVLAIGGWLIQKRLQDQTLRRDYVQLAVSILKEPNSSDNMKNWAVNLLAENSPVPFDQYFQSDLLSGKIPPNFEVTSTTTVAAVHDAADFELKGFDALFNRDADSALAAFKNAENKSPIFHSVAEIRKLLEEKLEQLNAAPKEGPSEVWKEVYSTILKQYSWRLSSETKSMLADRISKS